MEKVNQRVLLTKRLLKEGLLRLLKREDINKINISELCAEAGINRATFYKHYTTPRDVLVEIGADILYELKLLSCKPASLQEAQKSLEHICSYLYEKADLVKILIACNTDADLAKIFDELNERLWDLNNKLNEQNRLDRDDVRLTSTFLWNGSYSLIRQWLAEDIPKTPQEIAWLIFRIVFSESFLGIRQ
ncbi:MAG: TetR-like C-terminal domain-containing protein [Lachnospiraceae bacterium]